MVKIFPLEIVLQLIVLSRIRMALTHVPRAELELTRRDRSVDLFHVGAIDQIPESEQYESQEIEVRATKKDITYHFYSKNLLTGAFLKHTSAELLNHTDFRVERLSLFVVHGWKGSEGSHFNYHVKEALLDKHDINLFVVDWSPVAKRNYVTAQRAVLKIGKYVAAFIESLVSMYGLQLAMVAFVGHSLGAHVSGNAGAALNGQVGYIVGLDPASPLFKRKDLSNRLDSDDAKFVQVIHTNGGFLGVSYGTGHSDYYPNGGSRQTGCGYDLFGRCAHARAWAYYAESVSMKNNFVGRLCASYDAYVAGQCQNNHVSLMAGYNIDTNATGNYYLITNESPPFGKG